MRLLSLFLLIGVVLPLALCRDSHTCASLQCDDPLSECCEQSFGAQCYNAHIHRCAQHNNSLYLCPLTYPNACGRACYNSTEYHCVDGKLVHGPEPNPTDAPTQPDESGEAQSCEHLSCSGSLSECCMQSFGAQCYNPHIHRCAEHNGSLYLCPLSYPNACGRACYNASEYHCVGGKLVHGPEPTIPTDAPTSPDESGESTSCEHLSCSGHLSECCLQSFGAQCYDPRIHRCAEHNGSLYLCPLSYPNACGRACYNSTEYHCVDGKLVRGAEPNPTDAPTQPTDEDESEEATSCDHLSCSGRLSECCLQSFGAQCYDPLIHTCAEFNSSYYLCPIYYPKACNRACYHPSEYHCEDGKLKQGAAAPESQESEEDSHEGNESHPSSCEHLACSGRLSQCCPQSFGAQCYDSSIHTCAEFNSSYYLCPLNHPKACGSACYHPSAYHCESGELKQGAEPVNPSQNPSKCSESTCASVGLSCCEVEMPADGSVVAQCYSNHTYNCKGKMLCLLGLESCGHACYHTDYFTCEDDELKSRVNV